MDKLAESKSRNCWICFNNEQNITLTTVNSEKILKNCGTYLDVSIIRKCIENDTPVLCCRYCYESATQCLQLQTLLEEQVIKLEKEISNVALLFSKSVLERRNHFENQKDEDRNKSILPSEMFLTSHTNTDPHSILETENVVLKKEVNKNVPEVFPSHSQKTTDSNDLATGVNCENIILSYSNNGVKYSYDEAVTKSIGTAKIPVPPNLPISAVNTQDRSKRITTSVGDWLKCLKTPLIQLQRLQTCKSRNAANIADIDGEERINPESHLADSTVLLQTSERVSPACYNCSFCPKTFSAEFGRLLHERLHTIAEPLTCFSSAEFNNEIILQTNDQCETESRQYKCSFCSKSYLKLGLLKIHERFHTGERPFTGPSCSESLVKTTIVKSPKKTHSVDSPYKCSFCQTPFLTAETLELHEKCHTGEKPYACSFCWKSFSSAMNLKVHKKSHSGEKIHKCSFCSKSFYKPSDVKRHEMMHTGERPYTCSICSKSFRRRTDLRNHGNVHSEDRPYQCSFCLKSFKRADGLKAHAKIKCVESVSSIQQQTVIEEIKEEFILP